MYVYIWMCMYVCVCVYIVHADQTFDSQITSSFLLSHAYMPFVSLFTSFYKEIKAKSGSFEVLYISSDK